MADASGFVLNVSAERRKTLEVAMRELGRFAEAVNDFEHSRNLPLICFMSFLEDRITHIGRGRRGVIAATGKRRLNVWDVTALPNSIPHAEIIAELPNRFRSVAQKRFIDGGLLPPATFSAFVETLLRLVPASRLLLARFSEQHRRLMAGLSAKTKDALAYQKEALVTALGIAKFDRTPLQEWSLPSEGPPTSFLEGLPSIRLREDPMVIHDLNNVLGYELIKTLPHNAAIFDGVDSHLTVILANRLPLEEQFGTDLIYYNEKFKSFVMVQYKAMEKEEDETIFRLPAKNLPEEIARMDAVLAELRKCAPNDHRHGFRFSENPFFLKLCPRIVLNPDNIGMVSGMYLPLDYWRFLEIAEDMKGSRGGRQVTFQNVGRWMDNSSFIELVGRAWVGTTPSQSMLLEEVIKAVLEGGKAVILAIKVNNPPETKVSNIDIEQQEDITWGDDFDDLIEIE